MTDSFNPNFTYSHNTAGTNPILNTVQGLATMRCYDLMKDKSYYHNSFDYFNITKENLVKLKLFCEQQGYELFHHTGCSKEFMVVDKNLNIFKVNYSEDRKEYYVMSYTLYKTVHDAPCEILEHMNKLKHHVEATCKINSFYFDEKEGLKCQVYDQKYSDVIIDEAYPNINQVQEFFDRYYASKQSVLIFIGMPGTGKTSLIRNIIAKYNSTSDDSAGVFYTASATALNCDSLFQQFMSSKSRTLVLEDIDLHLSARNDGNTFMYKLLSTSDGLIKNDIEDKKIIISTNLPNIGEIDEALIRKGRCFGIVEFRKLTAQETIALLKKFDRDYSWVDDNGQYTVAEALNH